MRITCLNLSSQSLFISTIPRKPAALLANNPSFCHLLHLCAASVVTLQSVFQPRVVLSPSDTEADVDSGLHSIRTVQTRDAHTNGVSVGRELCQHTVCSAIFPRPFAWKPDVVEPCNGPFQFWHQRVQKKAGFAETSPPAPPQSPQRGAPTEAGAPLPGGSGAARVDTRYPATGAGCAARR